MGEYSQSGEEKHILAWAERHGPGRWLDLGAADGVSASNTRALAEQGWGGVAVEPAAILFDRLASVYADRDDVATVQALIVTEPDAMPLRRFHYSRDLVSTTEDENAETWREHGRFVTVWAAAVTIGELLQAFPGPYDFASVDTEGTSLELWNALRRLDIFDHGALAVVEAEDGGERREIQEACKEGWARTAVTPNNVLLERL